MCTLWDNVASKQTLGDFRPVCAAMESDNVI